MYISPRKKRYVDLLAQEPKTEYERQLHAALRESDDSYDLQKDNMAGLQAQSVLHEMYTTKVRRQLEFREEKAASKKGGKLNLNGHAKLLSGDDVFHVVQEHTRAKAAKEAATTKKKAGLDLYKKAVEEWNADEWIRKKEK